MRDLNIDFMDLYKSVDNFLKDAYSSSVGVTEYITQMEKNSFKGQSCVPSWNEDYSKLKHLRWIRNQLAHEVGYNSDICAPEDYDWLKDFYNRLFSANDPVARLRKAEAMQRQRQNTRPQQSTRPWPQQPYSGQPSQNQTIYMAYSTEWHNRPEQIQTPQQPKSLWQRIKDFFLG